MLYGDTYQAFAKYTYVHELQLVFYFMPFMYSAEGTFCITV